MHNLPLWIAALAVCFVAALCALAALSSQLKAQRRGVTHDLQKILESRDNGLVGAILFALFTATLVALALML